jgi:YhcH/YjgK/YiaL family protein
MILDAIENIGRYRSISANMAKAIDFVCSGKMESLSAGKHPIDGETVFVLMNEYETKPEEACKTETHRKYVDIQLMLKGSEKVGFGFLEDQKIIEGYNNEKDYTFYDTQLDFFELKQNWFAIFFPTDLHCPSIAVHEPKNIRKAVIKVMVE